MSFPRHEGIFRSDGLGLGRSGAQSERLHAPTHRLDEFPTGYSSAGWSPPEPVSASPAEQKFTMKAAPQPSLFQRMGKPCLTGCLTAGVHRTTDALLKLDSLLAMFSVAAFYLGLGYLFLQD